MALLRLIGGTKGVRFDGSTCGSPACQENNPVNCAKDCTVAVGLHYSGGSAFFITLNYRL